MSYAHLHTLHEQLNTFPLSQGIFIHSLPTLIIQHIFPLLKLTIHAIAAWLCYYTSGSVLLNGHFPDLELR